MEGPVPVINAASDKVRQHIVLVAGHDQMADGKPHKLPVVACQHIAEVPRGHTEIDALPLPDNSLIPEGLIGFKIIDHLGDQPSHIDGVGAGQEDPLLFQLCSRPGGKYGLYGRLGVVKVAPDPADRHILPFLGDHLQPLDVADLAFRIEYGDGNVLHIPKAVQGRLSRVAAGGRHDHDPLSRSGKGL